MTQSVVPREFSPLAAVLAERGVQRQFQKGTLLVQEGDLTDNIHMVLTGSLRVFSQGDGNREYTHDICGPGQIVGMSSLDGGVRDTNIMALESTTCSVVSRNQLLQYLESEPGFAVELLGEVIRHARKATQRATTLALNDVYGRLAILLKEEASLTGPMRKTSHQAIAARIGASREMVSRLLRDLEAGGYIEHVGSGLQLKKDLPLRW